MPKYSAKPYSLHTRGELEGYARELGFDVRAGEAGQLLLSKDSNTWSRATAAQYIKGQGFRGASGRFLTHANVEALLSALESRVPLKDWGYSGTFFKITIPAAITGPLERLKLLNANSSLIINAMNLDIAPLLRGMQAELKNIAITSVTKNVYIVKPEIIHYGAYVDWDEGSPTQHFLTTERTDALRLMVAQGVRIDIEGARAELIVDFDERLAPYWIWVEKGHRVVMPGGYEPGTIVGPRPFVEQLFQDLYNYVSIRMEETITRYGATVVQAVGDWLLGYGYRALSKRSIRTQPSTEARGIFAANKMTPELNIGFGLGL